MKWDEVALYYSYSLWGGVRTRIIHYKKRSRLRINSFLGKLSAKCLHATIVCSFSYHVSSPILEAGTDCPIECKIVTPVFGFRDDERLLPVEPSPFLASPGAERGLVHVDDV